MKKKQQHMAYKITKRTYKERKSTEIPRNLSPDRGRVWRAFQPRVAGMGYFQ